MRLLSRLDRCVAAAAALSVFSFSACDKPAVTREVKETPADSPSVPVAPVATPAPIVAVVPAPEVEPAPVEVEAMVEAPAEPIPVTLEPSLVAPMGVVFLLKPVSIETADGVFGLEPGTAMTRLPDGTFLARGHKVKVAEDKVTNVIQVAANAFRADQAAQILLRKSLQEHRPVPAPNVAEAPVPAPAPMDAAIAADSDTIAAVASEEPRPPDAPAEEVASVAVERNRVAPEGTYFLIRSTSVVTSDGVIGLAPGTKATKLRDGSFMADGHRVELTASDVTNDVLLAEQLAGAEQAGQALLREKSHAAAAAEREAAANRAAALIESTPAAPLAAPTPRPSNLGTSSGLQGSRLQRGGGL